MPEKMEDFSLERRVRQCVRFLSLERLKPRLDKAMSNLI